MFRHLQSVMDLRIVVEKLTSVSTALTSLSLERAAAIRALPKAYSYKDPEHKYRRTF